MKVLEVQVKKGKRRRDLIILSVDESDFSALSDGVLQGDFHRGVVFLCHEAREKDLLDYLKSIDGDIK